MARHFFTGGLMPSLDLPKQFEGRLLQRQYWVVNGQHYANTCKAWLKNLDQHKTAIVKTLAASDNPIRRSYCCSAGECLSWPVRRCSRTKGVKLGWLDIFLFEKAAEQHHRQTAKEVV